MPYASTNTPKQLRGDWEKEKKNLNLSLRQIEAPIKTATTKKLTKPPFSDEREMGEKVPKIAVEADVDHRRRRDAASPAAPPPRIDLLNRGEERGGERKPYRWAEHRWAGI